MAPLLCAAEKPKKQVTEHDTRRLSQRDDFGSEQTPPKGSSKPKKVGPHQHHPIADVLLFAAARLLKSPAVAGDKKAVKSGVLYLGPCPIKLGTVCSTAGTRHMLCLTCLENVSVTTVQACWSL